VVADIMKSFLKTSYVIGFVSDRSLDELAVGLLSLRKINRIVSLWLGHVLRMDNSRTARQATH